MIFSVDKYASEKIDKEIESLLKILLLVMSYLTVYQNKARQKMLSSQPNERLRASLNFTTIAS